jgi:hypothetical protein
MRTAKMRNLKRRVQCDVRRALAGFSHHMVAPATSTPGREHAEAIVQ